MRGGANGDERGWEGPGVLKKKNRTPQRIIVSRIDPLPNCSSMPAIFMPAKATFRAGN